jgi:chorismate-pyruvate lyase
MVRVEAPEIPPPYRRLLAHNADMTTTLEAFHGEALALRVCGREETNDAYCREVVLALQSSDRPVEYGAICIHLRRFPRRVQGMIRTEEHPFGRILQNESIAHLGWPQAFFVVGADLHMSELLGLDKPALLYGRRNVLLNHRRQLLAEVIEILPPAPILPHCGVTSS